MKTFAKILGLVVLMLTFAFTTVDKKTIVIDVSHGGHDTGASFGDFQEKEIALNIALKIKELNKNSNLEIILTRETDEFLTLQERIDKINELKPDMVISLHTNTAKTTSLQGTDIYISDKSPQKMESGKLAMQLFHGFTENNTQIKKADFLLLRKVKYPIALIELGFISNEEDRKQLTTVEGQNQLAHMIFNSLQ